MDVDGILEQPRDLLALQSAGRVAAQAQHPRQCDQGLRGDGWRRRDQRDRLVPGKQRTRTETYVRHIDYVANLVGAEHVGIGFDYVFDKAELDEYLAQESTHLFRASEGYGTGMDIVEPEQLPAIAEELVKKGYSDDDLRAILGGNHLRVAQQVWK